MEIEEFLILKFLNRSAIENFLFFRMGIAPFPESKTIIENNRKNWRCTKN